MFREKRMMPPGRTCSRRALRSGPREVPWNPIQRSWPTFSSSDRLALAGIAEATVADAPGTRNRTLEGTPFL
jgi:hypothetical protein